MPETFVNTTGYLIDIPRYGVRVLPGQTVQLPDDDGDTAAAQDGLYETGSGNPLTATATGGLVLLHGGADTTGALVGISAVNVQTSGALVAPTS